MHISPRVSCRPLASCTLPFEAVSFRLRLGRRKPEFDPTDAVTVYFLRYADNNPGQFESMNSIRPI